MIKLSYAVGREGTEMIKDIGEQCENVENLEMDMRKITNTV